MESNGMNEQPGPEAVPPHETRTANSDDWRYENDKSICSSISHQSPEPGFAHIDGDIRGPGYNETLVDVITVPCPGASAVDTWTRDALPDGYFSRPRNSVGEEYATVKVLTGGSILSPAIDRHLPAAQHIWVRQGIRGEVSTARVMLYRHRQLREGITLEEMAEDLLEQIVKHRDPSTPRPLFFICHSIGGLVAKAALVKAREREDLRWLMYNCHGMTFFSTPHRGSSYLSMPNLRYSIQHLLYLDDPLPRSVTDQLRVNNKALLSMHDSFMDIASEMHLWTFYETRDSQLSGWGHADSDEVHFSAPLTSIKSGLLASRHEQVYSLESDHAGCAAFGENNLQIMHSYLSDLAKAVAKAEKLNATYTHHPMRLVEKIKMEIIGFYNDPDPETSNDIRLYVSKHFLQEFFEKGPERCLQERLNTVAARPRRGSHLHHRTSTGAGTLSSGALGIWSNVQDIGQNLLGRFPRAGSQSGAETAPGRTSPDIVVTTHASPGSLPPNTLDQYVPAAASRRTRGLTVPALATPGFHRPSSRSSSTRHAGRLSDDEVTRSFTDPVAASPRTAPTATGSPSPSADNPVSPGEDRQHHASVSTDQRDQVGQAVALEDFSAGFSRPEAAERKFMWIHVPFNNPHWVKSVLNKVAETNHQTYSSLLRNDNWVNRQVRGRHAQSHASYIRPGCGFVPADHHASRPSSPSLGGRNSPAPSPAHLYLYLPYLHYDTYKNLVKRRDIIRRRLEHGRARPVPQEIADEESLDSRVIWEFIAYDPPLHARRSLDQYGYPSLLDTSDRDDDQMLYKLTKKRVAPEHRERRPGASEEPSAVTSPASRLMSFANNLVKSDVLPKEGPPGAMEEDDILDGNVLMVDQLWLWAVDNTTLATFFPKRESHATEGPMFQQADLRNSVYNELNGDLTGRCESALDLAAFTALHAVTVLLDRSSHRDLEVFRILEEAIGILTERMTLSLKSFRMQTYRDRISDESGSSDLEDNRSETIKRRHRREMERAERENRENTSALLELRDMDDELSTMKSLFAEQGTVIEAMRDVYDRPELQGGTKYGRAYLDEALQRLEEYTKQVTDMLQRIENTRNDYEKLLEMVQRQAQVDEVRWSRLQAELASTQNTSVMIFTTFTVIFLPLSFFTSVFGMNTREWGGEHNVALGTIGAISLPASACLIAASLVAAFSSRVQALFKYVFLQARAAVDHTKRQVARLRPRAAQEAKRRRRQAKEERERSRRRHMERGYDFWGTVRTDRRGSGHQVPELNRMAASRRRGDGRAAWRTWGAK